MTIYTVGTLFSGIGVPDLAAELVGMRVLWQVEIDDANAHISALERYVAQMEDATDESI